MFRGFPIDFVENLARMFTSAAIVNLVLSIFNIMYIYVFMYI